MADQVAHSPEATMVAMVAGAIRCTLSTLNIKHIAYHFSTFPATKQSHLRISLSLVN